IPEELSPQKLGESAVNRRLPVALADEVVDVAVKEEQTARPGVELPGELAGPFGMPSRRQGRRLPGEQGVNGGFAGGRISVSAHGWRLLDRRRRGSLNARWSARGIKEGPGASQAAWSRGQAACWPGRRRRSRAWPTPAPARTP